MTRTATKVAVVVALALTLPPAAQALVPSEVEQSVVSLLSPGHGTAFAFGRPGHLIASSSAVGSTSSPRLVTVAGQALTTTAVKTTDPRLVELRGKTGLSPLHGASRRRASSSEWLITGPLGGPRVIKLRFLGNRGETSLPARAQYDGAPIVTDRGLVDGVAILRGGRTWMVRLHNLKALPAAPRRGWGLGSIIPVAALVLAVALGVVVARRVIQLRERAPARRSGGTPHQPHAAVAATPLDRSPGWLTRSRPSDGSPDEHASAYVDEPDTDAHVILRAPRPEEPPPDVRLLGRTNSPRGGSASRPDET